MIPQKAKEVTAFEGARLDGELVKETAEKILQVIREGKLDYLEAILATHIAEDYFKQLTFLNSTEKLYRRKDRF